MSRFDDKFAALEPMGKDLLRKLLAMDPSRRITAKEALDHDYFWTPPLPTKPEDLPKYPACHEFTAKKRRQQAAQNVPPAAATQQQPQGATTHWAGAHQRPQLSSVLSRTFLTRGERSSLRPARRSAGTSRTCRRRASSGTSTAT